MRSFVVISAVAAVSAQSCNRPNEVTVVTAEGSTNYALGQSIGISSASSIFTKMANPQFSALQAFARTEGSLLYEQLVSSAQATFPRYVEELHGIADGARANRSDIWIYNMMDELEAAMPSTGLGMRESACTDIHMNYNPQTEPRWLVHNEDARRYNLGLMFLVDAQLGPSQTGLEKAVPIVAPNPTATSLRFTAFMYPGQLASGAFGYNEFGFFFSTNAVFPLSCPGGLPPRAFVHRYILESKGVKDALDRLHAVFPSCGFSVNFGAVKGNASGLARDFETISVETSLVNVETSSEGAVAVVLVNGTAGLDTYYHANMYLNLDNVTAPQLIDESSVVRLARLRSLPKPTPSGAIGSLFTLSGDTYGAEYPVWRQGNPPDCCATIITASFEVQPASQVVDSSGNAGEVAFLTLYANNPKTCGATPVLTRRFQAHSTSSVVDDPAGDMALIKQRLLTSYVLTFNVSGADSDVGTYLPLISPPGTFRDLNYTPGMPSGWGGYPHCTRMAEMGSAYFTPASTYYQSSALYDALLGPSGVYSWFLLAQPQDPANWWFQMIGCGRPMAQLSLQFQVKLSSEQAANATSIMDRAQWISYTNTGTNAADIAVVHIGNGLLNNNITYVTEAFDKIWSTVVYSYGPEPSNPEGPKPDGSFMQHGPQLYNGNYGASWTKDSLSLIAVAANTSFNASGAAYEVATHVTLDGCARMIHWPSAQWDPSVIGRQMTNPEAQSVTGSSGGDAGLLDPAVLRSAGGPRADELNALADALENPANVTMPSDFRVFPCSDYAVQRRAGYYASVRMISARTAGGECINGQGLQSLHTGDGVQYIMKTGFEFASIAPTWDWQMLPGITVQVNGTSLNCSTADGTGSGTIVGGVTADNRTGVAYMDFNNTRHGQQLVARKAYFFFDGFLLNMGTGVRTLPGFKIFTTLDSRLLAGQVLYSSNNGSTFTALPNGTHSLPSPGQDSSALFHHQDMGFSVLDGSSSQGGSLFVLNEEVTGNWSSVGTYSGPPITNNMFTLAIDVPPAAVNDVNSSYVYGIWPDVDEGAFTGGAWKATLERYSVWANTWEVQAVWDKGMAGGSGTLYGVAYEGNNSVVLLPSDLTVGWMTPPFPAGFIASISVNRTSGDRYLNITFSGPDFIVSSAPRPPRVGHTDHFTWLTGGAFVPCAWPQCPGQWPEPKGYKGPPGLKYSCFANGTIQFTNPPSQVDEQVGRGGVPAPMACTLA